ncbi:YpdA family putative bacillithiol disulfide reductase [Hymenobacter sp. HMF4947]|uniref:YpdA family putative bacillithiol disulfide reductase n=1 Tax=Hymenobacter ginkgonis TaxID=2682976 RepID=A0A7K1TDB2_9BACT|nr:YpdA family putative bacillithiol disulfide reductase [Hymenobacter ginkgonis]MVN76151.1 YpdA family putative bacillithiol disulfide reductase [Hymenobacter ginkgonis]
MSENKVDAVVIGAGPVGLACALEIQRQGLTVAVVDKGALVNSIVGYPTQMEFFSTPELLEIGGYPFPMASYKPHREDALDYYQRVAATEKLNLRLYEKVIGLRGQVGDFVVETTKGEIAARTVVVATGFFDVPNKMGIPGEDLPHVNHYYKEPYAHANQDVVVVGAKNSSAKAALALTRAGARVTLVVRGPAVADTVKYWIRPDLINRIAEGRITAYFNTSIDAITHHTVAVTTPEGPRILAADYVYALTGYQPDYSLLIDALALPLDENDAAKPPIFDTTTHETARPGVYVAGTVCGGLATSRWFIENGRHHAQLIAAALALKTQPQIA